jgi:hypothetical protein
MAKQKVALECLSYHATAPPEQTMKLATEPVKSAEEYKLYSFKFIGDDDDLSFRSIMSVMMLIVHACSRHCYYRFRIIGRGNVQGDDKDVC